MKFFNLHAKCIFEKRYSYHQFNMYMHFILKPAVAARHSHIRGIQFAVNEIYIQTFPPVITTLIWFWWLLFLSSLVGNSYKYIYYMVIWSTMERSILIGSLSGPKFAIRTAKRWTAHKLISPNSFYEILNKRKLFSIKQ